LQGDFGLGRGGAEAMVLAFADARREATMGSSPTLPQVSSSDDGQDYDHGITTMIMELPHEENGCRFF
jgi:hypothetical protein